MGERGGGRGRLNRVCHLDKAYARCTSRKMSGAYSNWSMSLPEEGAHPLLELP